MLMCPEERGGLHLCVGLQFYHRALYTILTRATLCIARSLPLCGVRLSVKLPVLCLNG